MTPAFALELAGGMINTTLLVLGPILGVVLAVGLVISLFQAVTQINEATLSFLPKMAALAALLLVLGPWMMGTMMDYTTRMIELMPQVVR